MPVGTGHDGEDRRRAFPCLLAAINSQLFRPTAIRRRSRLHIVVVDRHTTILEVHLKRGPMITQVAQRLAELALGNTRAAAALSSNSRTRLMTGTLSRCRNSHRCTSSVVRVRSSMSYNCRIKASS